LPSVEPADIRTRDAEVLIIGAGVTGIYQLFRLTEAGFDVKLLEAGSGVGGVWHWNRYPMARFDSESYTYGYFFSKELFQEWQWKERFAGQPETESYLNYVVDRFQLRDRIELNFRVVSAVWDEADCRWQILSSDGQVRHARHVVAATGLLSVPFYPAVPGREAFTGLSYHTGSWPAEGVDFVGKRVAVVGTGSSGVQIIPPIAEVAAELTVYQRTANWCTPLNNSFLTSDEHAKLRESYAEMRATLRQSESGFLHRPSGKMTFEATSEERWQLYEKLWNSPGFAKTLSNFDDIKDARANALFCAFLEHKIREIVQDPDVAEALIPRDHGYGMKRPPFVNGYYECFNKSSVSLVDLKTDPIAEITSDGIATRAGKRVFDIIVWATGFDAGTGALLRLNLVGVDGRTLRDHWADGPQTYLGIQSSGFPNFYFPGGPHGGGLGNLPRSTEIQVDFIARLLRYVRMHGYGRVEAEPEAERAWTSGIYERAKQVNTAASSWFLGANVPGKPTRFLLYPGGQTDYSRAIAELTGDRFSGFAMSEIADGEHSGQPAEDALNGSEYKRND
jgi:cation diffusion facilitator CzcD-associated flavoprotein CzcO